MKIPKLFKKAAAFVMAAVTALSIMPICQPIPRGIPCRYGVNADRFLYAACCYQGDV